MSKYLLVVTMDYHSQGADLTSEPTSALVGGIDYWIELSCVKLLKKKKSQSSLGLRTWNPRWELQSVGIKRAQQFKMFICSPSSTSLYWRGVSPETATRSLVELFVFSSQDSNLSSKSLFLWAGYLHVPLLFQASSTPRPPIASLISWLMGSLTRIGDNSSYTISIFVLLGVVIYLLLTSSVKNCNILYQIHRRIYPFLNFNFLHFSRQCMKTS